MFRSFYARISLLFLLLILILGSAALFTAFNASRHLFDEVEQLLNREYAASIALELSPLVEEGFTETNIKSAIHYMMVLNPMVEIYLLDNKGRILAYFTHPNEEVIRNSISVKPLQEFINSNGWVIVQGDDPRTRNSVKPFSAAPLQMGDTSGYVYVILRGQSYDRSLAIAGNNYYIKSGLYTFSAALVLTFIIGLVLFSLLTRRLRELRNGVHSFQQGKWDYRVKVKGRDELSDLGKTFNEMADTIQKGVNDLKIAQKERTDLIANISHDLRSPLTSIRGHLETFMLKEKTLSDTEKREFLEIALKNVAWFQDLVAELFDLAKLESGQTEIQKETFLPAELLQDAVLKLKPMADRKMLKIAYHPSEPEMPVSADIGLFERAVTNILQNAITHTPENGIITIELEADDDSLLIRISDTGPGIPEQDLPHIFERFYRADKSRNRADPGTGLGLAIAKEIIERHNGSISAANGAGSGAVFTVRLNKKV